MEPKQQQQEDSGEHKVFFPSRNATMNAVIGNIATSLLSLLFVLSVVAAAWYLLWTFVIAPNPLVRDFFDLDKVEAIEPQKKKER